MEWPYAFLDLVEYGRFLALGFSLIWFGWIWEMSRFYNKWVHWTWNHFTTLHLTVATRNVRIFFFYLRSNQYNK